MTRESRYCALPHWTAAQPPAMCMCSTSAAFVSMFEYCCAPLSSTDALLLLETCQLMSSGNFSLRVYIFQGAFYRFVVLVTGEVAAMQLLRCCTGGS